MRKAREATLAGTEQVARYLEKRYFRQNLFLRTWRLGRSLADREVPVLPLVIRVLCRLVFQADVPVEVTIPRGVVFMHNGLGVVVHTKVVFSGPAIVFHNVTIGNSLGSKEGEPLIGSHVMIGTGAVLMGPIVIGDGSVIGANAVVTKDIPPGSLVVGNPATIRRGKLSVIRDLFHGVPESVGHDRQAA